MFGTSGRAHSPGSTGRPGGREVGITPGFTLGDASDGLHLVEEKIEVVWLPDNFDDVDRAGRFPYVLFVGRGEHGRDTGQRGGAEQVLHEEPGPVVGGRD